MRSPCLLAALAVMLPAVAHAEPAAPLASRPSPALATTFELLSPVGGAGCFYRHRWLAGALVTAGSLIGGGLMIHGLVKGDRDETSVNAVAYGVARLIGVVAAVRAGQPADRPRAVRDDLAPFPLAPAPRAMGIPVPAAPRIGFSYAVSF
jgi:hypothetical protein